MNETLIKEQLKASRASLEVRPEWRRDVALRLERNQESEGSLAILVLAPLAIAAMLLVLAHPIEHRPLRSELSLLGEDWAAPINTADVPEWMISRPPLARDNAPMVTTFQPVHAAEDYEF